VRQSFLTHLDGWANRSIRQNPSISPDEAKCFLIKELSRMRHINSKRTSVDCKKSGIDMKKMKESCN
jgi:hypothetical protein